MQVDNSLLNKFAKLVDNSEQNKQSVPTEMFGVVTSVPSGEVDYYVVEPETATQGVPGFNGNVTSDDKVPSAECQCYSDITDEIQVGDRVRIRIDSGKSTIIENMVKRGIPAKMVIVQVKSAGASYHIDNASAGNSGHYTGTISNEYSTGVDGWIDYLQYLQQGFKPTGLASVTLLVSKNDGAYNDITKDTDMLPTTAFASYSIKNNEISATYALGGEANNDNRKFKVALDVVMMKADFFNNQGE